MRRSLLLCPLFAFGTIHCTTHEVVDADEAAQSERARDVYEGDTPIDDVSLDFDILKLLRTDEGGNYIDESSTDGKFIAPSLGVTTPLEVTISVRGNTSLASTECSFPKLKLKFKDKTLLRGTALKGHSTLRIATHCGELPPTERTPIGRVANELSPWREAFVYRAIRAAGVEGPRARPATIRYVDLGGAELRRKAAFIETTGDVADRLGGEEAFVVDSEAAVTEPEAEHAAMVESMDHDEVVRVQLAEALVGNSDFRLLPDNEMWWFVPDAPEGVSPFWNMKAVRMKDGKERPIPVDFDLAAVAAPRLGTPEQPDLWAGTSIETQTQLGDLTAMRYRFPRARIDAGRRALAEREATVMALLDTPWLDAEGREVASRLFTSFFTLMRSDHDFYIEVVHPAEDDSVEYVREDGTPNDTCITTEIPPGTPIHRFGKSNAALGIEQVALLDVRFQLPCNERRVWIKTGAPSTTNFPE